MGDEAKPGSRAARTICLAKLAAATMTGESACSEEADVSGRYMVSRIFRLVSASASQYWRQCIACVSARSQPCRTTLMPMLFKYANTWSHRFDLSSESCSGGSETTSSPG